MTNLDSVDFSLPDCQQELEEFRDLLENNDALSEEEDILPHFKERKQLSLLLGTYHGELTAPDQFASEFRLFGEFRADLAVGDSEKGAFVLIEFEDATESSVFQDAGRERSHFGRRLEKGFSQLVEWLWVVDDESQTRRFEEKFGTRQPDIRPVLVVGRSHFLSEEEESRLVWRSQNVLVDSKPVSIITFDRLADDLSQRISMYSGT